LAKRWTLDGFYSYRKMDGIVDNQFITIADTVNKSYQHVSIFLFIRRPGINSTRQKL
jgi:hypothetical protein